MVNDVGMIKGIIQSRVALGPWRQHLEKFPFDVRRVFFGSGAPTELLRYSTLGQPMFEPVYRYRSITPKLEDARGPFYKVFADAWANAQDQLRQHGTA